MQQRSNLPRSKRTQQQLHTQDGCTGHASVHWRQGSKCVVCCATITRAVAFSQPHQQVVSGELGPCEPSKQLRQRLRQAKGKAVEEVHEWVAEGTTEGDAGAAGAVVYDEDEFAEEIAAAEQETAAAAAAVAAPPEQQKREASEPKAPAKKKARRK